jgi:hypothetical protein
MMNGMADWVWSPDLVGLSVGDALVRAESVGVLLEGPKPDGLPVFARTGVVTAQDPPAGIEMANRGIVVVTIQDDPGGAPVREPRPLPPHGLTAAEADPE